MHGKNIYIIVYFPTLQTYPVNGSCLGKLLLINNFEAERKGSQMDVDNIVKTFRDHLGLQLYGNRVHNDLTDKETKDLLTDFAGDQCHASGACAIVAIMSHGGKGGKIIGYNGKSFFVHKDVLAPFANDASYYLRGKPKLFLFQACRYSLFRVVGVFEKNESCTSRGSRRTTANFNPPPPKAIPRWLRAFMNVIFVYFSSTFFSRFDDRRYQVTLGPGRSWTESIGEFGEKALASIFKHEDMSHLKYSDMMQVFPNVEQHRSVRDCSKGSWFVQVFVFTFLCSTYDVHQFIFTGLDEGAIESRQYRRNGDQAASGPGGQRNGRVHGGHQGDQGCCPDARVHRDWHVQEVLLPMQKLERE